jgi:hypothetical protein
LDCKPDTTATVGLYMESGASKRCAGRRELELDDEEEEEEDDDEDEAADHELLLSGLASTESGIII